MTSGALNWRSLVSLVLIAGFCGTALVWVNAITAPRIETQRQEQARALMNSLLQPEQRIELKALEGWRGRHPQRLYRLVAAATQRERLCRPHRILSLLANLRRRSTERD